ncbi:MAG: sigma-70 family RNA polymerase sigma factor [Holophagales bacterium]|nr:sigma-70 family RNA polymerase sigma factor [Holophagales bacterium]
MSGAVERVEGMPLVNGALPILTSVSPLDEMVLRVRGGEIEAFDEIMLETEGRVLGLAWRLLGDKEQARDASQEAYLRIFKSLDSYRIGESFMAWVGRITANVCFDYLKKRGHLALDSQTLESIPSPISDQAEIYVLQQQRRELIQKALSILTPAERSALVLRDMEGLSTNETARVLGLKAGTVRTQISSARNKIKNFCQRVLHKSGRSQGGRL